MNEDRWSIRWSPCEMMYLEITEHDVIMYLDHAPNKPDRFSFEQVLSGEADRHYINEFGADVVNELKAAVQRRLEQKPPKTKRP